MLKKILHFLFIFVAITAFAPSANAVTDLSSFSVLATNSLWIRQNATVNSGNIGSMDATAGPWLSSNSEVAIGLSAYVAEGVLIYGDSVKIKTGGSVDDVYYNELDNNGTVRGNE